MRRPARRVQSRISFALAQVMLFTVVLSRAAMAQGGSSVRLSGAIQSQPWSTQVSWAEINDKKSAVPQLGYGYSNKTGLALSVKCVDGTLSDEGRTYATTALEFVSTREQLRKALNIDASARARLGAARVNGSTSVYKSFMSDAAAMSFEFVARATLLRRALSASRLVAPAGKFEEVCGQGYVREILHSAALLVRFNFYTTNTRDSTKVTALLNVKTLGAGFSADLKAVSAKLSSGSRLTISVEQLGGDVAQLGTIFRASSLTAADAKTQTVIPSGAETGSNGLVSASAPVIDCGSANIDACTQFLRDVIAYVGDGFGKSVAKREGTFAAAQISDYGQLRANSPPVSELPRSAERQLLSYLDQAEDMVARAERRLASGVLNPFPLRKQEVESALAIRLKYIDDLYERTEKCYRSGGLACTQTTAGLQPPATLGSLLDPPDWTLYCALVLSDSRESAVRQYRETMSAISSAVAEKLKRDVSGIDYHYGCRDQAALALIDSMPTLDLDDADLHNLAPLSTVRHLRALSLRRNALTDVAALEPLTELRAIDLSDNRLLRDLGGLSGLDELEHLVLDRIAGIADASRIGELPRLGVVVVDQETSRASALASALASNVVLAVTKDPELQPSIADVFPFGAACDLFRQGCPLSARQTLAQGFEYFFPVKYDDKTARNGSDRFNESQLSPAAVLPAYAFLLGVGVQRYPHFMKWTAISGVERYVAGLSEEEWARFKAYVPPIIDHLLKAMQEETHIEDLPEIVPRTQATAARAVVALAERLCVPPTKVLEIQNALQALRTGIDNSIYWKGVNPAQYRDLIVEASLKRSKTLVSCGAVGIADIAQNALMSGARVFTSATTFGRDEVADIVGRELGRSFADQGQLTVAARIQRAFLAVLAARNQSDASEAETLRDAEYYLFGLYAAAANAWPETGGALAAPIYDAVKWVAQRCRDAGRPELEKLLRSSPNNPTSEPGGAIWAYRGLLDGWKQNGGQVVGPSLVGHGLELPALTRSAACVGGAN